MYLFRFILMFLVVVNLAIGTSAAHEVSTDDGSSVVAEITVLASSIDRLTAILEAQAGSVSEDLLFQKLNLAIAYLNFRSRRIEMLEQDVQQARVAKGQIESTLNVWMQQRDELTDSDPAIAPEEVRQRQDEIELRINLVKERMSRLDDEIVSLENKIYELQDQINSVEAFVQKNLAL